MKYLVLANQDGKIMVGACSYTLPQKREVNKVLVDKGCYIVIVEAANAKHAAELGRPLIRDYRMTLEAATPSSIAYPRLITSFPPEGTGAMIMPNIPDDRPLFAKDFYTPKGPKNKYR